MNMFRRQPRQVPGLNMSSMPDLIFTVLFFFMIVTHLRSTPVKVSYQVPAGTELNRLTRKSAITYIYVGKELNNYDGSTRIQLNDKFADVTDVETFVREERHSMSSADRQQQTVSIKADRQTDMGTMTDIRMALRKAKAYRVNYSAVNR